MDWFYYFVGVPALFGIFLFIAYSAVTWLPEFITEAKEVFKNAESSTVEFETSTDVDTRTD